MSGFIRLIGSICIFVFIGVIFFGDEIRGFFPPEYKSYAEDLITNKWALLIGGIVLSFLGTVTKVKKILKKSKPSYSVSNLSANTSNVENNDARFAQTNKNKLVKKDFIAEQFQHKKEQFINSQSGRMKELATKVDWIPLRGGGANFKTSFLNQVSSSRIEVTRSKGGLLFNALFIIVGLGVITIGGFTIFKENRGFDWEILFPLLFGGIFAAIGFAMMYWPRPRIFDLRMGWFWCGNKNFAREHEMMKLKQSARLSEIAALQIISERVTGSKGGSYTSWELNLVSDKGDRLNVMDHGKYESIVADAEMLGRFLGVPVWENT